MKSRLFLAALVAACVFPCAWGQTVWTLRESGVRQNFQRVEAGGGVFLAAHSEVIDGSNRESVRRSEDGITWTETDLPYTDRMAFGGGKWVGIIWGRIGAGGGGIWTSSDGRTATATFSSSASDSFWPLDVAASPGGEVWVVTGYNGRIKRSTDQGATWRDVLSPLSQS